jgi:hypothetical protein
MFKEEDIMLLTKTVIKKWNSKTKQWYINKGYPFTKIGNEFEIIIEDLTDGCSSTKVNIKCDCPDCNNPYLKPIKWQDYLKCVHEDGKYYCKKCAKKLYGNENYRQTKLKNSKSFEQWCIDNNRQDVLNRWDYELNSCKPSEITFGTKYKCYFKCPKGLHESELKNIGRFTNNSNGSMNCVACNSFAQWCLDNKKLYMLDLWDYEINRKNPYEIPYATSKKYYFKCLMGLHTSELKRISSLTVANCNLICKACNSFEQWCINNNRQDILSRWDYELNKCNPIEIRFACKSSYYFKCSKGIHPSELKSISNFTSGSEGVMFCNMCNSFAQYLIDNFGNDALNLYWDYEKNGNINPWKLTKSNNLNVYIKCQNKDKPYHESYLVQCSNFSKLNSGCPYCYNRKIHPLDSLGTLFPEVLDIWSDKNDKSPFEYAPKTPQEVYWKCPEGKHDNYLRKINESNDAKFRCPDCSNERDESFLQEKVRLYLESLDYTILHERNCTIIPKNPRTKNSSNNSLPFDNEVKELKLIVEINGKQHYIICGFHILSAKRNNTTPEYELHYQKLKDRYKRMYAKSQGYHHLEISYLMDDENETWKKLINEKILEITNIK